MKQILTVILLLGVTGACLPAQSDETSKLLAALEQQRNLSRRLAAARKGGDLQESARVLAALAALPHLVARPFTSDDDPRAALRAETKALLDQEIAHAEKLLVQARQQAFGKACNRCDGRAFRQCNRCKGQGYRDRRIGRRMRRIECRAWDPCQVCGESGRLAANPDVHQRLQRLVLLTGKEAVRIDVMTSLKNVFAGIDGIPPGLTMASPKGGHLLKITGHGPFHPDQLKASEKKRLKQAWVKSLPADRREYLFSLALDAARISHGLRFLDGLKSGPSAAQVVKNGKLTTVEEIAFNAKNLVGQLVAVDAVGQKPSAGYLDAVDFPLAGRIPLQGVDPKVLLAFCYTPEDLGTVRSCAKLGIGDKRDRSIRSYPPRAVLRSLEKIGVGKRIRLYGRVLRHPDGLPAALLEVWRVDEAPAANEAKGSQK